MDVKIKYNFPKIIFIFPLVAIAILFCDFTKEVYVSCKEFTSNNSLEGVNIRLKYLSSAPRQKDTIVQIAKTDKNGIAKFKITNSFYHKIFYSDDSLQILAYSDRVISDSVKVSLKKFIKIDLELSLHFYNPCFMVYDSLDREPLANVDIFAKTIDNRYQFSAKSDREGKFSFNKVPYNVDLQLVLSQKGFKTRQVTFKQSDSSSFYICQSSRFLTKNISELQNTPNKSKNSLKIKNTPNNNTLDSLKEKYNYVLCIFPDKKSKSVFFNCNGIAKIPLDSSQSEKNIKYLLK